MPITIKKCQQLGFPAFVVPSEKLLVRIVQLEFPLVRVECEAVDKSQS
jgi:hypothetical protein